MSVKHIQFAVAGLALLLALTRVALWLLPSSSTALPKSSHVILLLVPDLSLSALKEEKNTPTLKALSQISLMAVLKTKPKELLPSACERIAAMIPRRVELLKKQGIGRVYIGGNEGVSLLGSDAEMPFAEEWRKADAQTPDGQATDIEEFAHILLSKGRSTETASPTFVVAIYDDLYRTNRYAPLVMPAVADEQRKAALNRLDNLLAILTAPNGVGEDTTLLLVSPTESEKSSFAPVLLWKPNISLASLTLAEPFAVPGILTPRSLLPTAFSLMSVSSPAVSGKSAFSMSSGGNTEQQHRIAALTLRKANRRYLGGMLALLIGMTVVVGILKWVHRPRLAKALATSILASPLCLYLASGVILPKVGLVYGLSFLGAIVVCLGSYWVPAKRIGFLYRCIALVTLAVFVLDALTGNWLAMGTPLTERGGGIGIWGGSVWGVMLGALLLCLHPVLLRWRWCALIAWGMGLIAVLLLGGVPATLIYFLFAFGVVVPREYATDQYSRYFKPISPKP